MNAPLASPTAETFSLKRRSDNGGTPAMNYWGCTSEYGVLTDVLLGKADHIKHLSTSSLSRKYLRDSPCNIELAKKQHAELISAYEHFGVRVHFHDIFLPDDYPAEWAWRRYNEQAEVKKLIDAGVLRVEFSSHARKHDLSGVLARLPLVPGALESSLWLTKA